MRDKVNAKIKYREEFRPFAPAILEENLNEYFKSHDNDDFPYMTFTLEAQNGINNKIPAVVHVDNTSRVQTVKSSSNSIYYQTIKEYNNLSGTPVIMNTSFNLKGQPIVETPRDALMTFFGCGMDALFIGNYLI
jgi:carbamoyltransferase